MNTPHHIPFDRRFVTRSDDNDKIDYSEFIGLGPSGLRWPDLLNLACVVILGEGRCGKTHEFRQQHQLRLNKEQFSFFIPLEQLHDSSFEDILSPTELTNFEQWKERPDEEATFFLDAVDELKVRSGALRKAIRKIVNAIDSRSHNAKFFISCRPADWSDDGHAELDSETVRALLPAPADSMRTFDQARGEDLFLNAVCPVAHGASPDEVIDNQKPNLTPEVQVVYLMPLNSGEARIFAQTYSSTHANRFLEHISRHDLWHLYTLPIDIIDAINLLAGKGPTETLGNLKDLLDWGITRRIRENSTKKRNKLFEDDIRATAERTALALCLTKHRSFTDQTVHNKLPEELCLADVMTNWTRSLQEELLHKSLFTPTGVGRFRFYHRTTEEYLAARKLLELRQSGLSRTELHSLLFADINSEQVVIPSMEPVAAWLAVLDADIFEEVKNRKPQLLLFQHFPTMLDTPRRAALITSFVDKYSGSQWRNLGIGWQDYEKLASPELGPTLKSLWQKAYTGHETRDLVLRLASITKMPDCGDFAYQAALDETLPEHQQIYAIWAAFKCASAPLKNKLAQDILGGKWPQSIVIRVLSSMYPDPLTVDEFLSLICSLDEHLVEPFGVHSAVLSAIQSKEVPHQDVIIIRDRLASLIWDTDTFTANYVHLTPALIGACCLTPPKLMDKKDTAAWARATVIGMSFGTGQIELAFREGRDKLKGIATSNPQLREAFICATVDLVEQRGTLLKDEWDWISAVDHNRRISNTITMEDRIWLLDWLSAASAYKYRLTAFYLLRQLLRPNETSALASAMLTASADCSHWQTEIGRIMDPAPLREHPADIAFRQEEIAQRDKFTRERTQWQAWHLDALAKPTQYLSGPTSVQTFVIIQNAIRQHVQQSGRNRTWSDWDADFIEKSFSAEFLEVLRAELAKYWRTTDAKHWASYLPLSKFEQMSGASLALMALKCNAETPGWENSLSPALAELATQLVLEELEGSSDILSAIESIHPEKVHSVFCSALSSGVKAINNGQHAPVIGIILRYGTQSIKRQACKLIASWLTSEPNEIQINTSDSTIDNLFSLLKDHGSSEDRIAAITAIRKHLYATKTNNRAYWLRTLSKFDFHQSCTDLLKLTTHAGNHSDFAASSQLFAAVFSSSRGDSDERFEQMEQTARLALLGDLLVRSYAIEQRNTESDQALAVRSKDHSYLDLVRGTLLRSVSSTVSQGTLSLLYSLCNKAELRGINGVLRQKITDVAAASADPKAMDVATFKRLESTKTYQAHDPVSLFNLMRNRLNDFEHELLTSRFSVIKTIRRIPHEIELRSFISYQLHHTSRGAYAVNQETVVFNENRTDISLQPVTMLQQYATIELKLAGKTTKWTASDLAEALTTQLVGKYLSNQQCQVGCLLICMRHSKEWRHPVTGQLMNLAQTVSWLQEIATELMAKHEGLYLCVKGIDYSASTEESDDE